MSGRNFYLICITITDNQFISKRVILNLNLLILLNLLLLFFYYRRCFATFNRCLYQTNTALKRATGQLNRLLNHIQVQFNLRRCRSLIFEPLEYLMCLVYFELYVWNQMFFQKLNHKGIMMESDEYEHVGSTQGRRIYINYV